MAGGHHGQSPPSAVPERNIVDTPDDVRLTNEKQSLGDIHRLHVRVDIDENDIGRFRPNLRGVAKPRGTPGQEFPISFVRVEPYVIPKKSLTGANTERVDTRVLQVIYAVQTRGRPLFVGQQMDVFLNTEEKK